MTTTRQSASSSATAQRSSRQSKKWAQWLEHSPTIEIQRVGKLDCPDGTGVEMGMTRVNAAQASNWSTPEPAIAMCVESSAREQVTADLGFGRFRFDARPQQALVFSHETGADITGEGPYDLVWLMLRWEVIQKRIESALDRPVARLPERVHSMAINDPILATAMSQCWSVMLKPNAGAPLMIDGLVNVILGRLLELGEAPVVEPTKKAKLSPRQLNAVRDLIEERAPSSLRLDDLADATGVSRFHFSRLFKATTGSTLMHYVQRRRVERAQTLMKARPEWTLGAIALDCGFSDQAHFTRTFKKHMGVSPSAWLKSL
ncbi:MAG: AraC family transcriptional regulator [Planctomycetota bacterium]